jgi:flagellar protein FlgJ
MEIDNRMPLRNAMNSSKAKDNPKALNDAATEVEALFINEMLKVMRQSVPSMSEEKGLGADIYTGMFDTELSKVLAQRGLGVKESLMEQFKRISEPHPNSGKKDDKQDAEGGRPPASMGVRPPASVVDNFDAALGVAAQKVK